MPLKLSHPGCRLVCPQCGGRRHVPASPRYSADGKLIPGSYYPVPCPTCLGSGAVLGAVEADSPQSAVYEGTPPPTAAAAAAGGAHGPGDDTYYSAPAQSAAH